jgi:hypothetical protein
VQRLIVAQIKQVAFPDHPIIDTLAGPVGYDDAPWFDWGPYLWASGDQPRNDGLVWCDGQGEACQFKRDFRFGDVGNPQLYWGDYTHPTADGTKKVSEKLVDFITGQLPSPQTNTYDWIEPWIRE